MTQFQLNAACAYHSELNIERYL